MTNDIDMDAIEAAARKAAEATSYHALNRACRELFEGFSPKALLSLIAAVRSERARADAAEQTAKEERYLADVRGERLTDAEAQLAKVRADRDTMIAVHDEVERDRDSVRLANETIAADLREIARRCEMRDDEYPLKAFLRFARELSDRAEAAEKRAVEAERHRDRNANLIVRDDDGRIVSQGAMNALVCAYSSARDAADEWKARALAAEPFMKAFEWIEYDEVWRVRIVPGTNCEADIAAADHLIAAINRLAAHLRAQDEPKREPRGGESCADCRGSGWVWGHEQGIGDHVTNTKYTCRKCDGSGREPAISEEP